MRLLRALARVLPSDTTEGEVVARALSPRRGAGSAADIAGFRSAALGIEVPSSCWCCNAQRQPHASLVDWCSDGICEETT